MTEAERVARCPSTHCERGQECRAPNDCIVQIDVEDLRRQAQAAFDRNDGPAYTALRATISRIERTAFSSLR